MVRAGRRLLAFAFLACLIGLPVATPRSTSAAAMLPDGFTETLFASGFGGRLTSMTFGPDGRLYVSEKQGSVRIVHDGRPMAGAFLTVPAATDGEKGLKAIAFDPAYQANGFVYVYYTHQATLKNRVSRFTRAAGSPDLADAATELVLVDGINSGIYHSGGGLAFGADGKLYISTGDASYAPSAQGLGNLDGKMLRINRDGSVPADNPFVGQAGKRPEIWAYGLRNPFTFAFSPGGRLFINDVGNATWEEVNEGEVGANYGWPTCEGPCGDARFVDPIHAYRHADDPGKSVTGAAFYTGSMFPSAYAGDYFFGDYVGNYIRRYDPATGDVNGFATNTPNPVDLDVGPDGALYYLSVEAKTVNRIAYGEAAPPTPQPDPGNVVRNPGFETTGSGWLTPWWPVVRSPARASFSRATVTTASGAASFRADIATASLDWHVQLLQPGIGLASHKSHTLAFSSRASSPRAVRVALHQNSGSYRLYFQHSFNVSTEWQRHVVEFDPGVDDPKALLAFNIGAAEGQVWLDDVSITAGETVGLAPVPTISTPAAGTRYRATDLIDFSGSATDAEDGPLPAASLSWEVLFHHDTHTHPFIEPFSGQSAGSFTVPDTGESSTNVWFRIHLVATDADGNTAETTRDIQPLVTNVTVASQPQGLKLALNGVPVTGPHSFSSVVRFRNELAAPATQESGGTTYRFVGWSDGGAATHTIVTPGGDPTYTAVYEPAGANLLRNGGFGLAGAGWRDPWKFVVRSPATAAVVRDTADAPSAPAALRVDMSAAQLDWHVQILQPNVPLESGTTYTLAFRARANSARPIRVAFHRNGGSYPVYHQRTLTINSTWQRYEVVFSSSTTDAAALFALNLGTAAGSIWFDDFVLTR
jgi:glucose/arabinose dehydrogenase